VDPQLTTRLERIGDVSKVAVFGEVDIATVPELNRALAEAVADASIEQLVIDLLGVTFMDSSGLGALMAMRQSHPELDIALVLGPGVVLRTIETTGLSELFHVQHPGPDEPTS
jgi:anti-sigma B factor antagonist